MNSKYFKQLQKATSDVIVQAQGSCPALQFSGNYAADETKKEAIMTQSQFIKIYGIPGTVEAISCGNPADASAFAVYQTITQFPALSLTVTDLRTLRATNFQRRTCTY